MGRIPEPLVYVDSEGLVTPCDGSKPVEVSLASLSGFNIRWRIQCLTRRQHRELHQVYHEVRNDSQIDVLNLTSVTLGTVKKINDVVISVLDLEVETTEEDEIDCSDIGWILIPMKGKK